MIIYLSPLVYSDNRTITLHRSGEVLTIDGEAFDFSTLPDGATIPDGTVPSPWITGPVERVDGALRIILRLPIGPVASDAQRFPVSIINPPDGPIALPQPEEPADVDA